MKQTQQPDSAEAELGTIKCKINGLYEEIFQHYHKAEEILHENLHRAKAIGDYLIRVKALIRHGDYEDWVTDNFKGKLSTGRAYKRLAEKWDKKVKPKLKDKSLTVRQAIALTMENLSDADFEEKFPSKKEKLKERRGERLRAKIVGMVEKEIGKSDEAQLRKLVQNKTVFSSQMRKLIRNGGETKRWDRGRFEMDKEWTRIVSKALSSWSENEREFLRLRLDLFEEMMKELRVRLIRACGKEKDVRELLGRKEYRELKEKETNRSKKFIRLRLHGQQQMIDSTKPLNEVM